MRRAPPLESLTRLFRLRAAALCGLVFCVLLAAGPRLVAESVAQNLAQNPAAFVTGLEDVPLMPELRDVPDAAVIFDKPSGRLVEAYAEGDVPAAAVLTFYRETLPQLGWSASTESGASAVFFRESERLEIQVLEGQPRRTVRFVLSPK